MDCQVEHKKNIQRISQVVLPLLKWYEKHARVLPWRENAEPYRVWVSEIMLQQTRVEAAKPYFDRFIARLPDLKSLAEVSEEVLLKLWEGLGYYNRARNLQKTAQIIMNEYHGEFPGEFDALFALPGIGEYTAGAICSIAFGLPTPAVDGNVVRVFSRVMEDRGMDKKEIGEILKSVYPMDRTSDFTQSLMELGATVCIPSDTPKCEICPIAFLCKAFQNNTQADFPPKIKPKARRKEKRTVFILCYGDEVAIQKREARGLLGGLWEFPNVLGKLTRKQAEEKLNDWELTYTNIQKGMGKKHVFTHVEWEMTSFMVTCENKNELFSWVSKELLLSEIALPTAFKSFCSLIK